MIHLIQSWRFQNGWGKTRMIFVPFLMVYIILMILFQILWVNSNVHNETIYWGTRGFEVATELYILSYLITCCIPRKNVQNTSNYLNDVCVVSTPIFLIEAYFFVDNSIIQCVLWLLTINLFIFFFFLTIYSKKKTPPVPLNLAFTPLLLIYPILYIICVFALPNQWPDLFILQKNIRVFIPLLGIPLIIGLVFAHRILNVKH